MKYWDCGGMRTSIEGIYLTFHIQGKEDTWISGRIYRFSINIHPNQILMFLHPAPYAIVGKLLVYKLICIGYFMYILKLYLLWYIKDLFPEYVYRFLIHFKW